MKCQATVHRKTTTYNLRPRVVHYESGPCTRNAVAKLGALCLCMQHIKLATDGLVEQDGTVASPGEVADVRRYPKKFPDGLYRWAKGLEPVVLDLDKLLGNKHIGDGRNG